MQVDYKTDGGESANAEYLKYAGQVVGTTIDPRTLLSTDYFNAFNEVIMLIDMMADMPEVLEDIRAWKFRSYQEHFQESGLSFGPLAIEAYLHSPAETRKKFDALIDVIRQTIEEAASKLAVPDSSNSADKIKFMATGYARHLHALIETGSGIVHGAEMKLDQLGIDKIF